ncbi:MAG: bifunctional folylpolyglutamate synthase/dihydrofolate synthase [Clostridia bacterium]|nr:bifunctional folylpolyglutamate synthase/dihydrofolate synthase [Clostridia bacterium]
MTEQEAITKIHSVYPTGKKNGLENMRALMKKLGNVHEKLNMVHVAGTNGKGSCCAMMERMLREAGYKTGMYTSPYIEAYNERIRIGGVPISGDMLAALVERAWPAVESCVAEGVAITEFELGTALAFLAFVEEKVDVAIIEVGLGGRLDPTNIITPLVSVITEVGMDHMGYLGNTIGEIALEKAGIMKRGVPVALGPQEKAALGVLMAAAKGMGLAVYDPDASNVREESRSITFDVELGGDHIKNLTVSLSGRHQAENACAALGAIAALRKKGYSIPLAAIRSAMADVHWPGRLEYFGRVLLDGAHNDPGVRALCGYCDKWLPKEKLVLLTGMMEDKETDKMAERLSTRVRAVVATRPDVPRAMAAEALAAKFASRGLKAYAKPDVANALAYARSVAGPDGIVLCAGSLYLIGAVRTLLRQEKEFQDVI